MHRTIAKEKKCYGPDDMDYFNVKGLNKTFGGLAAVRDLDFVVPRGSIVGIIGPNGAGKTTIFNLITGFVKPDSGSIYWQGREIAGSKSFKIANMGISRTFQLVKPFKDLSLRDNLRVACYGRRFQRRQKGAVDLDALIRRVAERIGLPDDLDQPAANLGQGELRLLDIARVLITDPDLLLLDEPLSGLSHIETVKLIELIRNINAEGTTILIIEHKLKEMMRIAEHIVVIDFGTKIAEGTPQEVVNNPAVKKAYLGDKKRHVTA